MSYAGIPRIYLCGQCQKVIDGTQPWLTVFQSSFTDTGTRFCSASCLLAWEGVGVDSPISQTISRFPDTR